VNVPERSYVYDLIEGEKKKKKKKHKPFPANFVSRKIIFLYFCFFKVVVKNKKRGTLVEV
jgi:hypothetical protein